MELRLTLMESIAGFPPSKSQDLGRDPGVTSLGRLLSMLIVAPCPLADTRDLAVPLMCSGLTLCLGAILSC